MQNIVLPRGVLLAATAVGMIVCLGLDWACYVAGRQDQSLWSLGRVLLNCPERRIEDTSDSPSEQPPGASMVVPRELGEMALECALLDTDGQEVRLKDFVGRMPVVLEFASFT